MDGKPWHHLKEGRIAPRYSSHLKSEIFERNSPGKVRARKFCVPLLIFDKKCVRSRCSNYFKNFLNVFVCILFALVDVRVKVDALIVIVKFYGK